MSLTIGKKKIASANFNGESSLPSLAKNPNIQQITHACVGEDAGLYIKYGFLDYIFPYKMQDRYDRATDVKEYMSVVLENEYLRAEFLPEFGGRIWSLFDKVENKELLHSNNVVRPCNLALRNAWLCGGIEFNCGMVGHSPLTCEPLFTATTKLKDGTPVLRMYAFERIRCAVYQMDFFLPEKSKVLYARMRIVNTRLETVPMYWWTNIATPKKEGYRYIFDAKKSFASAILRNPWDNSIIRRAVVEQPAPVCHGFDASYPTNEKVANDYFWNIDDKKRKFACYVDTNGYGFVQASTSRLKGRKMFTFGMYRGGKKWEQFLTSDDNKKSAYIEIQAGLGKTQYECLPMPPKNAWEWLEVFGPINLDAKKAHSSDWDEAVNEAKVKLEDLIGEEYLENLLAETHEMATTKADKVILKGNCWGELENVLRDHMKEDPICPHLDFSSNEEYKNEWIDLLKEGSFKSEIDVVPPKSWILQDEWTDIIKNSKDTYLKYVHLGAISYSQDKIEQAGKYLNKALEYGRTPVVLFLLAQVCIANEDNNQAKEYLLEAYAKHNTDLSLARETSKFLNKSGFCDKTVEVYSNAPESIKKDGRMIMYYSHALLKIGEVDLAYETITKDGGIVVSDIKENEISLTSIYLDIVEEKAKRENRPFDRKTERVPDIFEFRVNSNF